jgi:hypothetical protein
LSQPTGQTVASKIPTQTPLFHAVNRDRYERQNIIKEIEQYTGRRLIVYIANLTHPQNSITREDIAPFTELVGNIEPGENVDLMIQSPGGDPDAAETIVNALVSKVNHLRVIIPQAAKSAATMMSLAADEIVMSDTSELGPIDPQIPISTAYGFIYRPAQAFLNGLKFIEDEHKTVTALNPAYFPFLQGVDAALIDYCFKSIEHSKKLAIKWLSRSMCSGDQARAVAIAETLVSTEAYPSHGAVINHLEATSIGLNVNYMKYDEELWQMLWRLFVRYTVEIREKEWVKVFESNKTSVTM